MIIILKKVGIQKEVKNQDDLLKKIIHLCNLYLKWLIKVYQIFHKDLI